MLSSLGQNCRKREIHLNLWLKFMIRVHFFLLFLNREAAKKAHDSIDEKFIFRRLGGTLLHR